MRGDCQLFEHEALLNPMSKYTKSKNANSEIMICIETEGMVVGPPQKLKTTF